jgi:YD repeat-containing protein
MSYDTRRNLSTVRQIPKTGTGYLEATATFPSACTSTDRRTCNRPTATTDFNGNTTDYTYDPAHGGVLTETGPAVNGVRPQTRHSYAQRYAWISNGSGGYAQAPTPVWVRTSTSSCRTSAASTTGAYAPCSVAGDEVLTQYDYGPNSGPNNLWLRGQTVTSSDPTGTGGALVATTLRTCYTYDPNGNRISETSPNANLTSCP